MATKAKSSLISSFLKLVDSSDYDKITVTNLVEVCEISRQTFYYHFDDIDKMVNWAFENETKIICNGINDSNLSYSAEQYAEFFRKYDTLMRKALVTNKFIKIYNLLNESFKTFISKYISVKHSDNGADSEDTDFFISYCASAFTGLAVLEVQKESPNYSALMKKLFKSIKSIT